MSADRRHRLALVAVAALALATAACSSTTIASQAPATTTTAAPAPTGPTTTVADLPGCTEQNVAESIDPNLPVDGDYVQTIRDRGRLIVGTAADVLLFSYRNPQTGTIEGFDADVVREIATAIFNPDNKDTEFKVDDHIEYRIITYAQRIPKLQDGVDKGGVDLVAHTMTINCKRWNQIDFSTKYYDASSKLLMSTTDIEAILQDPAKKIETIEIDDLKTSDPNNKKTVCAANGSTNLEELEKHTDVVTPKSVDDLSDCLVLFQQGQVDAVLGDDTVLTGFAAQDPYAKIVGGNITEEPYGLGVSKDHPDLVQEVNRVLDRMRTDGTWNRLYTKHLIDSVKVPAGEAPPTIPEIPQPEYGREP